VGQRIRRGNWGWSIILLTIIINVIMLPLKHKGVVSMRKMQEIQPEVKAIQDRYSKLKATDPGEAEDEPGADGALQGARRQPCERLRADAVADAGAAGDVGAALHGDRASAARLSSAGSTISRRTIRTTVTPILMGASQMWQQKLTPSAGADPAQQKMLMFMPVMFTFMFLWAPAGLGHLLRHDEPAEHRAAVLHELLVGSHAARASYRPPAERRVKRAGGGKTDEAAAREP
jgi:YidC/Oxa1 family membrane protein insertase